MFEKIIIYLKQEVDKEEIKKQKIKQHEINTYFSINKTIRDTKCLK